jgi:3-deoxy-manno-octulosonate cytidylyltransferase (CMP-KDO synthetase)
MKIIGVIPARYQSSRFPGKPLALICGKPMIQHVYERVKSMSEFDEVFVATDDARIYDVVESFGGKAVMTGDCACGSDRVAEACRNLNFDIAVNIQGDEPLIKPEMVRDLISAFEDGAVQMATLKKEITDMTELNNPNVSKVVTDIHGDAMYFSRLPIPFDRDNKKNYRYYKHVGVYGYTKNFLQIYASLPQGHFEVIEQLEQLRALENGYKLRLAETTYESAAVDLPEHIAIIENLIKTDRY